MKKLLLILLSSLLMLTACNESDNYVGYPIPETNAEKTVFMYFPWSDNLYNIFLNNIDDVKTAIQEQNGLGSNNLMIFISQSASKGSLIKVRYEKGNCYQDTIKTYMNTSERGLQLDSAQWIKYILNQVKSYAPADTFAMVIGCHGMGWISSDDYQTATFSSKSNSIKRNNNFTDGPMTRWFGGTSVQTDITTLAKGISSSEIGKMQYILFDDCYLSNIETAYDLKDVTNYLIACPTEIMAVGMPYKTIWKYLIAKEPNYQSIVDEFYNFYNSYTYNGKSFPYGTIGITDCSQIDSIASIVKDINSLYTFDSNLTSSLQAMDGYTPTLFYDFGDYVHNLCSDKYILNKFDQQLALLVPYKSHTDYYYTALDNTNVHLIEVYSGITISDPSTSGYAKGKANTSWYNITH